MLDMLTLLNACTHLFSLFIDYVLCWYGDICAAWRLIVQWIPPRILSFRLGFAFLRHFQCSCLWSCLSSHNFADVLEQSCIFEYVIKVDLLNFFLQRFEYAGLSLSALFDLFNFIIDFIEDFVADQVIHVEMVNHNFNPGCWTVLVILLFSKFKDKTANVVFRITLFLGSSWQQN